MKKILFIDDDEIILKTVEYTLTSLNYDVTTINDSQKGLELALKYDYDLIITDFKMPNLSGVNLIKEVKSIKHEANIYLLSGFLEEDIIKQANNAGATGIMEKPFNIPKIISLMNYRE